MKIGLILISLIFIRCNNSDDSEVPLLENTFISQRNTGVWKGTTEINVTENDTLVFLGIGDGLDNGYIGAKVKFSGTGSYVLKDKQGIYYNTLGNDVIVSQYSLQKEKEGQFVVSVYDEKSGRIEGRFELPLKATRLSNPAKVDSILTIADGRFRAKIR